MIALDTTAKGALPYFRILPIVVEEFVSIIVNEHPELCPILDAFVDVTVVVR